MSKFKFILSGLAAMLLFACSSTQVGLKENWIDERDVMDLTSMPLSEWIQKAGRPTLVEINGDTSIYYYNYRPTMYIVAAYDSTSVPFKTWGKAEEAKPSLNNAVEVWGNRKNVMQIKIVQNTVISAFVADGPDKRTFIRDLNGSLVMDPKSGYVPSFSDEIKVEGDFNEYIKGYGAMNVKNAPLESAPTEQPATVPAEQPAVVPATEPAAVIPAADATVPVAPAIVPPIPEHAAPAAATLPAVPAIVPPIPANAVPAATPAAPAATVPAAPAIVPPIPATAPAPAHK
jgi:hypothetical protein